ncbi:uncharacterized protein LOC143200761 [Rhynchophorus ferrugineus]|uniref:Uncharacterized protein n=1 Tax=Rhynchophorus ferrugineus TaxID=354439 RepID=A0A834MDM1_RHYFE|nr:hypothetical protein GWI33_005548 [Rhynchophorus ferrugineus]
MSGKNFGKFLFDNSVLIVCVPLLVGIHWGWYKLQQNPDVAEESRERKAQYKEVVERMNPRYESNEYASR